MFDDFNATVRHSSDLPSCGGGTTGHDERASLPDDGSMALPLPLSREITLHNHTDSSAPSSLRDSQQVAQSSGHNIRTNGARLADELCHIALTATDFLGDLLPGDPVRIFDHAANAIDWAVEIHEELHPDVTVPLEVIVAARTELTQQAHDILADQARLEEDALLDAMEAGDLDHDGSAISYPRYRSV